MSSLEESLASWASIIATLCTIIGLIQSQPWLVTTSAAFLGASIFAVVYARQQRLTLNSATIKIEGRSIDSLNLANLRRRINRTLIIQDVKRVATIKGEDLTIRSTYSGFCRAKAETTIEFSIDADNNTPFHQLACCGYDLLRDPQRQHPIRPILQGVDGSSKKIALPFLEPLEAHQPFSVLLSCTLPGCMKAGLEYYTAALSFEQNDVPNSLVHLIFIGDLPDWVRVYEVNASGVPKLLRDLPFSTGSPGNREYLDAAENLSGQSARIYIFYRPTCRLKLGGPLGSAT